MRAEDDAMHIIGRTRRVAPPLARVVVLLLPSADTRREDRQSTVCVVSMVHTVDPNQASLSLFIERSRKAEETNRTNIVEYRVTRCMCTMPHVNFGVLQYILY
jgi:hypothetical protein